MNLKGVKDLNVISETREIPEENLDSKISDIALSKILSDISPQARETKEKNKQMEVYQTKKFCKAKEIINKIKRQPTEWENTFASTSDKGLIAKIYEEIIKLNTEQTKNPI